MSPLTLTRKQALYVARRGDGLSQTEAVLHAGYAVTSRHSAEQLGHLTERTPIVQAALVEQERIARSASGLSRQWVLDMLKQNAERCMQLVPVTDASGQAIGVYQYHPTAANRALELIGKEVADMFRDRLSVDMAIAAMTPAQRQARLEQLMALATVSAPALPAHTDTALSTSSDQAEAETPDQPTGGDPDTDAEG